MYSCTLVHWVVVRGQIHAPAILPPRKKPPPPSIHLLGTEWTPRAGFDALKKDKNVLSLQEIKPWIFCFLHLGTNTDCVIPTPGKDIISFHILVLLPRISGVPGSSRDSEASYLYVLYGFPYLLHSQVGTVPEHTSDRSLPHVAFKFAIHSQFHGPTLRA